MERLVESLLFFVCCLDTSGLYLWIPLEAAENRLERIRLSEYPNAARPGRPLRSARHLTLRPRLPRATHDPHPPITSSGQNPQMCDAGRPRSALAFDLSFQTNPDRWGIEPSAPKPFSSRPLTSECRGDSSSLLAAQQQGWLGEREEALSQ